MGRTLLKPYIFTNTIWHPTLQNWTKQRLNHETKNAVSCNVWVDLEKLWAMYCVEAALLNVWPMVRVITHLKLPIQRKTCLQTHLESTLSPTVKCCMYGNVQNLKQSACSGGASWMYNSQANSPDEHLWAQAPIRIAPRIVSNNVYLSVGLCQATMSPSVDVETLLNNNSVAHFVCPPTRIGSK